MPLVYIFIIVRNVYSLSVELGCHSI